MNKRYQVFVSSTYADLKEERNKVIQALLNFDCIPCGMEYFPAADEDAWQCIERLIPQCDYYVVILAGMYGTIPPKMEKSYTHMEYELAVKHGVPVLGLLHREPAKLPSERCEDLPARRKKLTQFRTQVGRKLCRFWETADQLSCELLSSLRNQQNRFPRTGWVRADSIADDEAKTQIITLQKKLDAQTAIVAELREKESREQDALASGDDALVFRREATIWLGKGEKRERARIDITVETSWNAMLKFIREKLGVTWRLYEFLRSRVQEFDQALPELRNLEIRLSDSEIEQIHLQFMALGLIARRGGERDERWEFTAKGLAHVSKLLAIRKGQVARDNTAFCRVTWETLSTSPDPERPEGVETW